MMTALAAFDVRTLVLLVLAAGVAGLARGFSGFGAALIFMPAASALVTPAVAAPILLMIDGVLTLGFVPGAWRRAQRGDVAAMTTGALVGIPIGAAVLTSSDPIVVRWIIASVAACMLALLLSGWRYRAAPRRVVTIGVGAIAGLFGGLAQMSGPPVVAYWLSGHADATTVRANLILLFAIMTLAATASYIVAGLLTLQAFVLAVVAGPSYGAGLVLGARLFGMASPERFRQICFALIALSVILSLPV